MGLFVEAASRRFLFAHSAPDRERRYANTSRRRMGARAAQGVIGDVVSLVTGCPRSASKAVEDEGEVNWALSPLGAELEPAPPEAVAPLWPAGRFVWG